MRYLNKLIWTALIAGATAAPAFAQIGGGGGAMGGGGGLGGGGGGGGLGGGGGGSGGANSGVSLTALSATPQISAPTAAGGNTGNSVSTSNFLSQYYANPYYQGILTNSQSNNNMPGGFGAVTFNSSGGSTSSGGGQIGFAGTTGGTTARGATGARGGPSSTNSNQQGVVIPLPVQISYAAIPKFKIDPVPPAQLQADLISMLRRSKEVSFPSTVQLSTEGNVVTVRGNAKDRDEARSIESMIRLTPGVRSVKNELSYPKE